jgi:hypothetical protein
MKNFACVFSIQNTSGDVEGKGTPWYHFLFKYLPAPLIVDLEILYTNKSFKTLNFCYDVFLY